MRSSPSITFRPYIAVKIRMSALFPMHKSIESIQKQQKQPIKTAKILLPAPKQKKQLRKNVFFYFDDYNTGRWSLKKMLLEMKGMKKGFCLFGVAVSMMMASVAFVWMNPANFLPNFLQNSVHSLLDKIPLKGSCRSVKSLSKQDLISAAALSASTTVNVFYNRNVAKPKNN